MGTLQDEYICKEYQRFNIHECKFKKKAVVSFGLFWFYFVSFLYNGDYFLQFIFHCTLLITIFLMTSSVFWKRLYYYLMSLTDSFNIVRKRKKQERNNPMETTKRLSVWICLKSPRSNQVLGVNQHLGVNSKS